MSEVKVDKISPATGADIVTLGDSGDNFKIPSGGTLTIESGGTITNSGTASGLGGGKVLQVVTTHKTDTFSSTAPDTFTDITGFGRTITPSATTSNVLIFVTVTYKGSDDNDVYFRLVRDSTPIAIGDAAGSRERIWFELERYSSIYTMSGVATLVHYDELISTVSEVDYKLQIGGTTDTAQMYINRGSGDANSSSAGRGYSSITCMEIGA